MLGFLASSGGNPKKLLRDYIKKTLKMDDKYKSFSKRVSRTMATMFLLARTVPLSTLFKPDYQDVPALK